MKRLILIFLDMALCSGVICHAQNIDTKKSHDALDDFVKEITEDFDNFRRNSMAQFNEFVRNPWKEFDSEKPIPKPDNHPVPPVIMDDEKKDKPIEEKPIVIEEVVAPIIEDPQPQPVEPIEEIPVICPDYLNFVFFGTPEKVRVSKDKLPNLKTLNENSVVEMLELLCDDEYDNLIIDCLDIRKSRHLSDWAYLQMLNSIATEAYDGNVNEAELLTAYLFLQSGYKMRLANDGERLYLLYASKHQIYEKPSFLVDGEMYYGLSQLPDRLNICQASFPNEQSLSLMLNSSQDFEINKSEVRTISSERYADMTFEVSVNKNLLDFYSTYPSSCLDGNIMTRWAMYANTPLDSEVSSSLYPRLRKLLKDKSQLDAANMLLNTIQTGLVYEYDDKVWGGDRAFFAEESLFYPYCDCEDRSILLTRIIRDILGLNCLLVYYPGHLATAIEFTDSNVIGDHIMLDGHKYVIADPTYINAPIGITMSNLDNSSAKVIRLK
ncbi:MAG: hypothetical protein NC453_20390 [Muribaculum sp.]|nr:hypothetical protein [Muribaculum sp.]